MSIYNPFNPLKRLENIIEQGFKTLSQTLSTGFGKINLTLERINNHMANIDQASQNLEALVTVGDGMALLLGTLNEEIRNLKSTQTDPETARKIDALNAKIEENTAEWAEALVKNTPAEDEEEGEGQEEGEIEIGVGTEG